ncbi:MAG: hypothetical protein B2I17_07550 [Thermoplasmatales archaeon B_DKE]|nr:MAG: hypothetical protein B2I17_07550 [Thermoplasmatales archaeon B_DKE]
MGKLTGYILGVSGALLVSFYILSAYYMPLINWLGPYFGAPLVFILPILFLILGNPLTYPVVLVSWLIIAFLVALGARRGGKSAGTAFTVYLSILGFLGVSAIALLFSSHILSGTTASALSTSSFSGMLSTIPSGTNLYTIESEPLIGSLVGIFSSFAGVLGSGTSSGAGSPGISQIVTAFESNFLVYLIVNLVVFLVASYIFGRLLSRLAGPKRKKTPAAVTAVVIMVVLSAVFFSLAGMNQDGNYGTHSPLTSSGNTYLPATYGNATPSIASGNLSGIASALKVFDASPTTTLNSSYLAAGIVGKYGGVYNIYAMIGTAGPGNASAWFNTEASRASYFTLVIYTYNVTQIVNAISSDQIINGSGVAGSSSLANLLNIIPQVVIIEGYNGTISQAGSLAAQNANNIVSLSGGAGTKLLGSLNISLSTSFPGFSGSIYVYSGAIAWPGSVTGIISPVTSAMNQSGPLVMFEKGLESGYLIPGNGQGNMQGSVMVAGVVSPSMFNSTLLKDIGATGSGTPASAERIAVAGGIFYRPDVFHSSPGLNTVQYSKVFNYSGNIEFGSNGTYALIVGYPISGAGNSVSYNYTVYSTSAGFGSIFSFNGQNNTIIKNPGSSIDMSAINFTTDAVFPANLSIETGTLDTGNGIYTISTTVINHDSDIITNLSISDNSSISAYSGYMKVVSGTPYLAGKTIQPGGNITLSFNVSVNNFGSFTLSGPAVNYSSNGSRFNVTGTPVSLIVPLPSFLDSVISVEYATISGAGQSSPIGVLVMQLLPGFYLFEIIAILIVILDIFIEIRGFRKWRARKGTK